VAVVAAAVAVAGVPGQLRALDRLAAGGTGHRGGVHQAQLVAPAGGVRGQVGDGQRDQPGSAPQPAGGGRDGRQVGEQVPQPGSGEPQPAPLGGEPEQDLGHGQADQLGVGEFGPPAGADPGAEQLVDADVQGDEEGVEVGVPEASLEVDVALATPTLGTLVSLVTPG